MNNTDWTWEPSPKREFNRRRLERCYQLEYKDVEYKEECLEKVQSYNKTAVKTKSKPEKVMSYKNRPVKEPYWNFWRAVFAGWLIRYPMQIFKGIGVLVLGLFVLGVLVASPDVDYNNGNANNEVISE